MSKKGRNLPKEAIDQWPEIFGEVKLNVVPLRYLHTVLVTFNDGKKWEIKITAETKKNGWKDFEKTLGELIESYRANIDSVDFQLDTAKVKTDIQKKTQKFLKTKVN